MKKYGARVRSRWGFSADIKAVDVDKETDKSVWINGERKAKDSEYMTYFDTHEQAKKQLIDQQKGYIRSLETRIENAREVLIKMEKLSCPEE